MTEQIIDWLTTWLKIWVSEIKHLPFAVEYIAIGINRDPAVELCIQHHHIRFARIVTVGIWKPYVLDISTL